MTNRNDQLLPCPFCGGEQPTHDESDTAAWVECTALGCGACGPLVPNESVSGRERAALAWNTRAQLPAGEAVPYTLTEQAPFVIRDAQGRYVAELIAWDAEIMRAMLAAAPQPVSGEQKAIGKVLSEEEMGIGYDRKAGPVLWFGQPAPGFIYSAPPAAQDVSGLVEMLDSMVCAYSSAIATGYDRITALGGQCDAVDYMLAAFPDYSKAKQMVAAHRAQAQGGDV